MTREKAIALLKALKNGLHETGKDFPYRDEVIPPSKEALDMAIKALKQESVIDKIKEEIKALSPTLTEYDIEYENPVKNAIWEILAEVLYIIDEYREENEKQ